MTMLILCDDWRVDVGSAPRTELVVAPPDIVTVTGERIDRAHRRG